MKVNFVSNAITIILMLGLAYVWQELHPEHLTQAFEMSDTSRNSDENQLMLALVVSKSGEGKNIGEDIEHGVRHYLQELKVEPGHDAVGIKVFDDQGDSELAIKIANEIVVNPRIVGVIGHSQNNTALATSSIYQEGGIVMVSPTADDHRITDHNPWAFSLISADNEQGEFLAFYIEHAIEATHIFIISDHDSRDHGLIERFKTLVTKEGMSFNEHRLHHDKDKLSKAELNKIVKKMHRAKADFIVLDVDPEHAHDLLVSLKDSGYNHRMLATGHVGTPQFAQSFSHLAREMKSPGHYTNGLIVPTSFVLDISSKLAHEENDMYHKVYGHDMSWPFAFGYDTAKTVSAALYRSGMIDLGHHLSSASIQQKRNILRDELDGMDDAATGVDGITGTLFFNHTGAGDHPPLFVKFQRQALISDLNQFTVNSMPFEHYDPLEHVQHVQVGDEIFGISNVVYTGVKFNKLHNINIQGRRVSADFDLWFRYHGDFDPSDILFDHVVEGTLKITPLDKHTTDHVNYQKVRVQADFHFKLSTVDFFEHKVNMSIAFRHRKMNRNELIYVVDRSAYNTRMVNKPLVEQMKDDDVLDDEEEAELDVATLHQDIITLRSFGDPLFLEGKLPFSKYVVSLGLHQKGLSIPRKLASLIDHEMKLSILFVSALIFLGSFISISSSVISKRGIAFRVLSIAGMLFGFEVIVFTEGISDLELNLEELDILVKVLESLWIVYIAFLASCVLHFGVWPNIEGKTGNIVPSMAKTMCSLFIISIAATMIFAGIFERSAATLVATSGVVTVILGFSLREMIMDVFAGLILNVELPFHIGDSVKLPLDRNINMEGVVEQMNWRTVHLIDKFGRSVVIPNSNISIKHLINYSKFKNLMFELQVHFNPELAPEKIKALLREATVGNKYIIGYDKAETEPKVIYKGCDNYAEKWLAHYTIKFWLENIDVKDKAIEIIWGNIWSLLKDNDIAFDPAIKNIKPVKKVELAVENG